MIITINFIIAPTEPPQNVSLNIITSDSFVLSWEPLNLEQQNGRVINYHVIIQEIQITYLDNGAVTSMVGANLNRTYSVTGNRTQLVNMLHPDYNYTVSVAAATSGGIGTFSVPLTVTMPEDGKLLIWLLLWVYVCMNISMHSYMHAYTCERLLWAIYRIMFGRK